MKNNKCYICSSPRIYSGMYCRRCYKKVLHRVLKVVKDKYLYVPNDRYVKAVDEK